MRCFKSGAVRSRPTPTFSTCDANATASAYQHTLARSRRLGKPDCHEHASISFASYIWPLILPPNLRSSHKVRLIAQVILCPPDQAVSAVTGLLSRLRPPDKMTIRLLAPSPQTAAADRTDSQAGFLYNIADLVPDPAQPHPERSPPSARFNPLWMNIMGERPGDELEAEEAGRGLLRCRACGKTVLESAVAQHAGGWRGACGSGPGLTEFGISQLRSCDQAGECTCHEESYWTEQERLEETE